MNLITLPRIYAWQLLSAMVLRKFVSNTEDYEEKAASNAPTPKPGGERSNLSSTTFIDTENAIQPNLRTGLSWSIYATRSCKNKLLQRKIPSLVRVSCAAGSLPSVLEIRGEIQRGRPGAGAERGARCSPGSTHPARAALEHKGKPALNPRGSPGLSPTD